MHLPAHRHHVGVTSTRPDAVGASASAWPSPDPSPRPLGFCKTKCQVARRTPDASGFGCLLAAGLTVCPFSCRAIQERWPHTLVTALC